MDFRQLAHAISLTENITKKATAAMSAYLAACEKYDWTEAEKLRLETVAIFETQLDVLGTAYRNLEKARRAAGSNG